MPRNAFFAAALVWVAACSQAEDLGSRSTEQDGSTTSSSTGTSGGTGGTSGDGGGADASTFAVCDEAGACGDYVRDCTGCAVLGPCSAAYDGCFGDESCLEFNKCLAGCLDDAVCRDECATANPVGAERYGALVTCIVCQACPTSCSEFADFCL